MSNYPAIPDFSDDPRSMAVALRAVKNTVEQLAGLRRGSAAAPPLYVQVDAPVQTRDVRLVPGALWIEPVSNVLSWYNGQEWVALT